MIELVAFPLVVKVWTKTQVIVTIVKENVPDKQIHKQTNSYFINIDKPWAWDQLNLYSQHKQLIVYRVYIPQFSIFKVE